MPLRDGAVLADTNGIIEAVRTGCRAAVTGGLPIETVEVWRAGARRGDRHRSGYVEVTDADLERLAAVHPVAPRERAALALRHAGAAGLDDGERDRFAHALARADAGDEAWVLCSPDRAAIRVAVGLGWADRRASLDALVREVGARPHPPLARHLGEAWLVEFRTRCRLGG